MAGEGIGINDVKITEPGSEQSGEGMYANMSMPCSSNIAREQPQETDMSFSKESSCEGSGMELDVYSLAEVFSYLPHTDLFEVMLVNKHWERTVMEADCLWEKVEVLRKWDLGVVGVDGDVGASGPTLLFRVLRVAKEVKISSASDHAEEHMKWVGGVLGPNLTSLGIPTECYHIPFIPSFESSFLHLKSLVFIGEPDSKDPFASTTCNQTTEWIKTMTIERIQVILYLSLSSAPISLTSQSKLRGVEIMPLSTLSPAHSSQNCVSHLNIRLTVYSKQWRPPPPILNG